MLTGRIYDIQGFSVHDGPGIRTTVFLKGCPLRCPWCHSPESQSFYPQLCYMDIRCVGIDSCGKCLRVCPKRALSDGETIFSEAQGGRVRHVAWDRKECINCGRCAKSCFAKALYICGRDYTVEEVMERLRADKPFFDHSGGGLTASGGEALSQPEFTAALLHAAHAEGIHTALDTTGFAPYGVIERMLPDVDLFLYDLKHMDSEKHKAAVGVPNDVILENAQKIASAGGKFQIRIPVIPGFNDDAENLHAAALFCQGLGEAVELVQLLPYHDLGASKYRRIRQKNPMPANVKAPTGEEMEQTAALFRSRGLRVIIH